MAEFFVVMMNLKVAGVIPTEKIEEVLDANVVDWLRFSGNQYIVQYNGAAKPLSDAIRTVLPPKANILLLPVSLNNRSGWASDVVIDWLKKHAP